MKSLSWLVNLLCVELARLAAPNQLESVLESCRPVETLPEGLPDQRVERCMATALALMDLSEKLTAFCPGDAFQEDTIRAALVETPVYYGIAFGLPCNPLGRGIIPGEDIFFQVPSDLVDPRGILKTTGIHSALTGRWHPDGVPH